MVVLVPDEGVSDHCTYLTTETAVPSSSATPGMTGMNELETKTLGCRGQKKSDHHAVSEPHINTLGQGAKGLYRGMVPTHAASAI